MDIPNVGWAGYGNYDFEKLLEVDPDVILIMTYDGLKENASQVQLLDKIENDFNIPVITLKDYTGSTDESGINLYFDNIRIIGDLVDSKDEAESLIKKLNKHIELAKSFKTDNQEDKALFLGVTDLESGAGYVHGKDNSGAAYTTSLLDINNTYKNTETIVLGQEEILEMNPDIIFMLDAPQSSKSVEAYMSNPIFKGLNAVKNNKVYHMGQLRWWSDSKLMLPAQLLLFSYVYYKPENTSVLELYSDYVTDIFGISSEDDIRQLATTHKLDFLIEKDNTEIKKQ